MCSSDLTSLSSLLEVMPSSKGQVVLPAALRQVDGLAAGQVFEIQRLSAGEYLLKRVVEPGKPGLVDWLARCPSPDWFQPLKSESTDTLG